MFERNFMSSNRWKSDCPPPALGNNPDGAHVFNTESESASVIRRKGRNNLIQLNPLERRSLNYWTSN
jgi:hypothetical protein